MNRREIEAVIEHSCSRLMKMADPPVKYWLMLYVRGKGESDPDVQLELEQTRRYPPRIKLLKAMREDGTWPISERRKTAEDSGFGPPHGWTYMTMLRNLDWLHYYCATVDDGFIDASLEKMLSWQTEEGYIGGPTVDLIPRPYYNGLTLSLLLKYGRSRRDSRIERLIDWIMRTQRHDGGWNIPYLQDVKYQPEYKHMKTRDFINLVHEGRIPYDPKAFDDIPSCYWSTAGVLTGMVWMLDDPRIANIKRGGSFVLDGFFKKNYHPTFYRSESHWTTLKYPSYSGSGYWALDSLLYLGFGPDDPRTERPIQWLVEARDKDGFWYHKERPDRLSDQWITAMALMILRRYTSMM
ncbi:MAG: terpene cyclase/mutase family protein [Methanobacteriota archaeon]|nr:MAG: terpene cyclase/mutase family protein [Euryarchaeota archaeon]